MWEVDLGRLPLRWDEDGDAFDRQLSMLIRLGGSSTFGGDDDDLTDQIQYEPSDWTIGSWMLAQRDKGWIHCSVHSQDDADQPRDEQVTPWRVAVAGAVARIQAGAVATWNALIGPQPQLRLSSTAGEDRRPVALAAQTSVGPLRLAPGGVQMHEMATSRPHPIHDDRFPYSSWPMIVEGTAPCHGEMPDAPVVFWAMDDQAAAQAAQRAAALVTLVWGELWTVRQDPVRIAPGTRIDVPHLAGHHGSGSTWDGGCRTDPDHEARDRQDQTLPGWLNNAWDALLADPALSGALDAYYQAVRMDLEYPSFAAVGYVTVVEGIGGRGVRRPPAKASFRAALTAVMSAPDADELADIAYNHRNATAHRGALHGGERTLGYLNDSQFRISAEERFEEEDLARIAQAARAVLAHALRTAPAPGT